MKNASKERNHLSHQLIIYSITSCLLILQLFIFTQHEQAVERSLNLLFFALPLYILATFYSVQHRLHRLQNTWLINILFLLVGWTTYQADLQYTLNLQHGSPFYQLGTYFEPANIMRPETITSILIISSTIICLRLWYKYQQKKTLVTTELLLHVRAE